MIVQRSVIDENKLHVLNAPHFLLYNIFTFFFLPRKIYLFVEHTFVNDPCHGFRDRFIFKENAPIVYQRNSINSSSDCLVHKLFLLSFNPSTIKRSVLLQNK